jgi:hypothetical protein
MRVIFGNEKVRWETYPHPTILSFDFACDIANISMLNK